MLKKILILIFIGSLGANFFSIYVLDKALFYRKNLTHIEQRFPNEGLHIRNVKKISTSGFDKIAVFIGGSFVKFWFFPEDLPVKIFNQGGLEEKISTDYDKLKEKIIGSNVDYLFINSGFCEIHTAIQSGKDPEDAINHNFELFKKIVQSALNDSIIPIITTLTPVRPVFLLPYSRLFSIGSDKKNQENKALEKYNNMIRNYAFDNNLFLIDFNAAVKDKEGLLKKEFSITDGEHLDIEGYHFLDNFLRQEITRILNKQLQK
ncbi:MAG: hypothetical protein KKE61_07140 [Proteobacteria bacterium]|nr:hypothetical protein [Pseudomonadota bacterium]